MATKVIKTTFKLRRGTKEAWERVNPTLAYGEPGFEKDTYRLKIGNGETAWNDLNYFGETAIVETDGESIDIVNGEVTLHGFAAAETNSLASKGEDGRLTWIDEIDINMIAIPDDTQLIIDGNL